MNISQYFDKLFLRKLMKVLLQFHVKVGGVLAP
jgi:hypothetical protein